MNRRPRYKFRLYVAGDAWNSTQAIANLNALCSKLLPNRHEIVIVDVFTDPNRALTDGVFMTPTLVKCAPPPGCRIVGTLCQTEVVLQALGLQAVDT